MCKSPVKFTCPGVEGTEWERSLANAGYRNHLGIIAGSENLVGFFEILVSQRFLDNSYALIAQEPDYSLPRDASQKRSIGKRGKNNSVLRHKNVGRCQFRNVAQHVANNRVIEASRVRLENAARVVWV